MARATRYVFPVGQRFGKLEVIEDKGNGIAVCRCDCGSTREISKAFLKRGQYKTCGRCERGHPKHGMDKTPTYHAWSGMLQRCKNPKNKFFHRYGGRGISVCERWNDFQSFFADMGEKPMGLSLDRIDNDKGYSPENCRWATTNQQVRNRAVTLCVEHEGRMMDVVELAERHGLSRKLVAERLKRGLSIEDALSNVRYSRWK